MRIFRFALFASVAELVVLSAALAQPAPVPAPQQQRYPRSDTNAGRTAESNYAAGPSTTG